jgi:glycosyltransferase involved in cell wall biosynthesis
VDAKAQEERYDIIGAEKKKDFIFSSYRAWWKWCICAQRAAERLSMKKVAIGLPVYNGHNYLPAAIDSILAQSYGDFDFLISDNASTDGTEEICHAYAQRDRRIRYIRQAKNVGAAANHNLTVRMTDSPYFKWAAHDDLLAPGFLATCVDVLDRDPTVVLASPASMLIDEAGMPLSYSAELGGMIDRSGVCWPTTPEENDGLMASDPTLRFEAVMLKMVMCVEIFGLMRRSTLLRTTLQGPFGGADKAVLAQMSLLGRFWLGEETLFFRRCHAQQFSASNGAYRAMWFSGRRDSLFTQQIKLLIAYCRTVFTTQLTARQRYSCLYAVANRAISRGQHWRRLTGGVVGNS